MLPAIYRLLIYRFEFPASYHTASRTQDLSSYALNSSTSKLDEPSVVLYYRISIITLDELKSIYVRILNKYIYNLLRKTMLHAIVNFLQAAKIVHTF